MNLEKSFLSQDSDIAFEAKERGAIEKEQVLFDYCQQNGNSINFLKSGEDKKESLKLNHEWSNLEGDWKDVLEEVLNQAELFLRSPVFTDQFHQDHGSRREWEAEHIDKKLDEKIASYYKSNRFNISRLSLPFNFKSLFEMAEKNNYFTVETRKRVAVMIETLNLNFPDNLHEYYSLSDEQKLEVVEKMEPVFQEIVNLLSDK